MDYCLDTNIIIDIFHGDAELKAKIDKLEDVTICVTPINLAELFKGAYCAQKKNEALELVEDFASNAKLLAFDETSCRIFGQKYAELASQGKQTQEPDLMIASITIANNITLITRNKKDFVNISGLKMINL